MRQPPKIIALVGLESPDLKFNLSRPFVCCKLCGAVYQTEEDRSIPPTNPPELVIPAKERRDNWAQLHAKAHTEREHAMLIMSGMWCSDIAANKLASYGIINMTDGAINPDIYSALKESPAIPLSEVEN